MERENEDAARMKGVFIDETDDWNSPCALALVIKKESDTLIHTITKPYEKQYALLVYEY